MEIRKNNLSEVEKHARALMTLHGVGSLGFHFDKGTKRIACLHGRRLNSATGPVTLPSKITMSRRWALVLSEAELYEVMIHEIAHALTPTALRPHGVEFRHKVKELGGMPTTGSRCFRPSVNIDGTPRSY